MASKTGMERVFEERKALFDEELLGEQFEELEALQGPEDTFVEDLVNQFVNDMRGFLCLVGKELDQANPNIQALDKVLHQIKGTTASVGAKQLSIICNEMRGHIRNGEMHKCRDAFVRMENQLAVLDQRLGDYFKLCRRVMSDDGSKSTSFSYDSASKD